MPGQGTTETDNGLDADDVLYGQLSSRHPALDGPVDPRLDRSWTPTEIAGLGISQHGYFAGVDAEWSGSKDWVVKTTFLPSAWTRSQMQDDHLHERLLDQIDSQYSEPEKLHLCEIIREDHRDHASGCSAFSHQFSPLTSFRTAEDIYGPRPALFAVPSAQLRAVEALSPEQGEWRWVVPPIPRTTGSGVLFYIAGQGMFPIQGAIRTEAFDIAEAMGSAPL